MCAVRPSTTTTTTMEKWQATGCPWRRVP